MFVKTKRKSLGVQIRNCLHIRGPMDIDQIAMRVGCSPLSADEEEDAKFFRALDNAERLGEIKWKPIFGDGEIPRAYKESSFFPYCNRVYDEA